MRHTDSVQAAHIWRSNVCLLNQGVPMSKARNTTARLMCVSVPERAHNRIGPSEGHMPVALIGKTLSVTSHIAREFSRVVHVPMPLRQAENPTDCMRCRWWTPGQAVLRSTLPVLRSQARRSLCSRSMIAVVRVTLRDMRILLNASSSLAYAVAVFSDWDQALKVSAGAIADVCTQQALLRLSTHVKEIAIRSCRRPC
jgi:hypothetical protein